MGERKNVSVKPVRKILLVEDIPAVSDTSVMLLKMLGYDVELATNGKYALEQMDCATEPFDAIITDILMPEMDGVEFLQALERRQSPDQEKPKVLVVSGGGGTTPLKLCKDFVAPYKYNFLAKPFTLDELEAALIKLLK